MKKGDTIRECKYGVCIDSVIISDVTYNERGQVIFKSKTKSGTIIDYQKRPDSLEVVEEGIEKYGRV